MNPELQKELAAWLAALREHAEAGMNFATDQAPLVVQEALRLGRVESALVELSCVLGVILGAWVCWRGLRAFWTAQQQQPDTAVGFPRVAIGGAVGTASSIAFFVNLHWLLSAWFAPRIYIIEWLKGLL